MENASKALIIAGAVLISILIITFGVLLVKSSDGIMGIGTSRMNQAEIEAFNSEFLPFEGTIKGTEALTLIEKVETHNITNDENQISAANGSLAKDKISKTKKYDVVFTKTDGLIVTYSISEHK